MRCCDHQARATSGRAGGRVVIGKWREACESCREYAFAL